MKPHDKTYWESVIVRCLSDGQDEVAWALLRDWLEQSPENRETFEALQRVWRERSAEPRAINHDDVRERIWRTATGSASAPPHPGRWDLLRWVAVLGGALVVATAAYWVAVTHRKDTIYIVQHNEAGQRSQFVLPDNSKVWLQAGSTLRYPEDFSGSERRVSLEGEAFFDVARDVTKPFIVDTEDLSTTALGTSFNVSAYPGKPSIDVTLVTGKVRVEQHLLAAGPALLTPGNKARYEKNSHVIATSPAAVENIRAWTDGVLLFEGDDFPEFVRKIGQWYGVSVVCEGKVPARWSIRGRFKEAYLSHVLDILSFNKGFSYKLNDNKLTIIFPT